MFKDDPLIDDWVRSMAEYRQQVEDDPNRSAERMDLYVLDTDILTLFERGSETVLARVAQYDPVQIAISVVTVEEQLSGWYAQVRQAKEPDRLAWAYSRLAIRFGSCRGCEF